MGFGTYRHDRQVLAHHIREGRFQRSLALIAAFSSLMSGLEVAYEHYRGSYSQRIMFSPVVLSPLLFVAGVSAALSRRMAHTFLPAVSLATVLDGLVGLYFHVRGVHRKPGGWRFVVADVIMGPPVFAPLLFGISGYLGLIASLLRREGDRIPPPKRGHRSHVRFEQEIREGRFQRQLAIAAAASALFSGIEALYSHYKSNFRSRAQWTPVLLAPVMVVAGCATVQSRGAGRTLLPFASCLALLDGLIGTLYHVRGVVRRPGGMSMPLYNIMYGPPIFAPMLFSASGFLGLLASALRREG
ncbi:MAG: hypothetical protein JO057_29475 [Chloroflexi bacterium]|nr:hypothetical protein [Chloroflexota bacterium]